MAEKKLKETCLEMFDFLHDVISDIAGDESEEWYRSFHDEFETLRQKIEEAK